KTLQLLKRQRPGTVFSGAPDSDIVHGAIKRASSAEDLIFSQIPYGQITPLRKIACTSSQSGDQAYGSIASANIKVNRSISGATMIKRDREKHPTPGSSVTGGRIKTRCADGKTECAARGAQQTETRRRRAPNTRINKGGIITNRRLGIKPPRQCQ